jgi:hypothetical protein
MMISSQAQGGIENTVSGLLQLPGNFVITVVDSDRKPTNVFRRFAFEDPAILAVAMFEQLHRAVCEHIPSR